MSCNNIVGTIDSNDNDVDEITGYGENNTKSLCCPVKDSVSGIGKKQEVENCNWTMIINKKTQEAVAVEALLSMANVMHKPSSSAMKSSFPQEDTITDRKRDGSILAGMVDLDGHALEITRIVNCIPPTIPSGQSRTLTTSPPLVSSQPSVIQFLSPGQSMKGGIDFNQRRVTLVGDIWTHVGMIPGPASIGKKRKRV